MTDDEKLLAEVAAHKAEADEAEARNARAQRKIDLINADVYAAKVVRVAAAKAKHLADMAQRAKVKEALG